MVLDKGLREEEGLSRKEVQIPFHEEDIRMEESEPPLILSREAPPVQIDNQFACLLEVPKKPTKVLKPRDSP